MKTTTYTAVALLLGGLGLGCGSSNSIANAPPVPELGDEIDRAGQPLFNLALISPLEDDATRDATQNAYNAEGDSEQWVFNYPERLRTTFALLDGMDGICDNGFGNIINFPQYYDLVAIPMAYDVLFVNSESTSCEQYLGVEANFIVGYARRTSWINNDCGGRTPREDVVDKLLTSFAGRNGYIPTTSSPPAIVLTDNVDLPTTNAPSDTNFPFLAPPF